MENIYLFTFGKFNILQNDKIFKLNSNTYLKLSEYKNNDYVNIQENSQELKLVLSCNTSSNFYNINTTDNKKFIEIISNNYSNLLCKLQSKNAEVFVYENSIRLIYNGECFCHYFVGDCQSHLINSSNKILIFNEKYFLEFDINNCVFNKLNIEKYVKNNKKIEILCKIPNNFNYFLFFNINLENNSFIAEKYKTSKIVGNSDYYSNKDNLILSFFYLAKYGFEDAKKILRAPLLLENCTQYFSTFSAILKFDNSFFGVAKNKIIPIGFKTNNQLIVDID